MPAGEPWSSAYKDVTFPALNFQGDDIRELPYQTRMLLQLLDKESGDPPAFPTGPCRDHGKQSCPVPNMTYIDAPMQHGLAFPDGRYNYYTQAAYVDYQVGRLLDYLETSGLAANTLVIFATDHGTALFDHGISNDKHNFLDASLRIPLIMRYPGVLPSGETRAFATTLDLTATIVAAAAGPEAIPKQYQGFDLLTPLAQGLSSPRKVGVSCEYRAMTVVTPSWKLAYFPDQGEGRLWDRRADPSEQNDLFNVSIHENATQWGVKQGLLVSLLRWRAQQDPLGYLQANLESHPAPGNTAAVVVNYTSHLTGLKAELQLQDDALVFESFKLNI